MFYRITAGSTKGFYSGQHDFLPIARTHQAMNDDETIGTRNGKRGEIKFLQAR